MANNEYRVLDTKSFDVAIGKKDDLIKKYNDINEEYDRIVNSLLNNWEGRGADAFKEDARTVKTNIVGIFDILRTMCDTLTDCKEIFAECDTSLGNYNRNPQTK
ncbi:MAG: hypothetical protein E7573_11640 [Ruminococcaceae bacterium]|nr:hypothetical protein [Oscillospiraceae bacterium]MBR3595931.1 hypothetical protein [Clostridia bacterium]